MIAGKVTGDSKSVRLDLRALAKNIPENVIVRSLNRTADGIRVAAAREIRKVYNLPVARIKDQIKVSRAARGRLLAEVEASGRAIPLHAFISRVPKRGGEITVKVLRAGGRTVVIGKRAYAGRPFVAIMPSGHTGIFQRVGRRALPIKELYSISLPGAFSNEKVAATLLVIARERFRRELSSNLAFYAARGSR